MPAAPCPRAAPAISSSPTTPTTTGHRSGRLTARASPGTPTPTGRTRAVFVIDAASGARSARSAATAECSPGRPRWAPDGRASPSQGVVGDAYAIGIYELAGEHRDVGVGAARTTRTTPCGRRTARRSLFLRDDAGRDVPPAPRPAHAGRCATSASAPAITTTRASRRTARRRPRRVFSSPGRPQRPVPRRARRRRRDADSPTAFRRTSPAHDFTHAEHVRYRSLDLLADVPGAVSSGRDEHNGGGVVIIHGGPTWHHSNEWDALREAFLDAGFMVVHPNYRGSDGYGRRWQLANRYPLRAGRGAGLRRRARLPRRHGLRPRPHRRHRAQPRRLPHRRRCSLSSRSSGRPASPACRSSTTSTRRWTPRSARTCAGGTARTPATSSRTAPGSSTTRRSTISTASTPRCSSWRRARDPRCPTRLVGKVVDTLRAAGQICEAHIYPDEGHEISGVENHVDYDRRTVEFILKHTGVGG